MPPLQDTVQDTIDNMSFSVNAVSAEVEVSNEEELKFEAIMDNGDVIKVDSYIMGSPNPRDREKGYTIVTINNDYKKEYRGREIPNKHTYEVATDCYKEYKNLI